MNFSSNFRWNGLIPVQFRMKWSYSSQISDKKVWFQSYNRLKRANTTLQKFYPPLWIERRTSWLSNKLTTTTLSVKMLVFNCISGLFDCNHLSKQKLFTNYFFNIFFSIFQYKTSFWKKKSSSFQSHLTDSDWFIRFRFWCFLLWLETTTRKCFISVDIWIQAKKNFVYFLIINQGVCYKHRQILVLVINNFESLWSLYNTTLSYWSQLCWITLFLVCVIWLLTFSLPFFDPRRWKKCMHVELYICASQI